MKMQEVVEIFYSIYLYKTQGYDCFKYEFKLPAKLDTVLKRCYEKNKFVFEGWCVHSKNIVVLKSVVSLFHNNGNLIIKYSEKDYDLFMASLMEWKNEFNKFLESEKPVDAKGLYNLMLKKHIPFYVFYYVLKYVRFPGGFADKELIRTRFQQVHLLMKFFKHFDEEYIKGILEEYTKEINLNKESMENGK